MRVFQIHALGLPLFAVLFVASAIVAVGTIGCEENHWTVSETTTLSITTSGAEPYQDVEVDIEVTPLLAELGAVYVELWMDEHVTPESEHPRLDVDDPYYPYYEVPSDGGVGYTEPVPVGRYSPYAHWTAVHIQCTGEPCRATVQMRVYSATPRMFTINGTVVVQGPDDSDPAPGRIYATWRTLP